MSQVTKVATPKQAKKVLRSITQGMLNGPPEQIEALRQRCLRIIKDQRAEVIPLKGQGVQNES